MFPGNPAGTGANLTGPTLVATNMNIDDSTGPALVDTPPSPRSADFPYEVLHTMF